MYIFAVIIVWVSDGFDFNDISYQIVDKGAFTYDARFLGKAG